jgi:hypothetical protein
MNLRLRVRLSRLVVAGAIWSLGTVASPAADALPQPLKLEDAVGLLPEDLPAEKLAREYAETAVRARAYECRAPDGSAATAAAVTGGCGYWHLLTAGQQTRLQVIRRFLDVMEADLATARDDEAMAVAYVQVDRARNRAELGQYSALEVSELEVDYQRIRAERHLSQAQQRATRALLAIALGRPDELPSELSAPSLASLPETIPEVDELTAEALAGNPVVIDWRSRAAEDPALAPLAAQIELDLREAVLELWLSHGILLARRDMAVSREHFRDLSLDYNRTLYELEVKADLGDAMSRQTAARLTRLKTEHQLFLLHATLNALRGRAMLPASQELKR